MYTPIRKADLVVGGTSIKQGEIFTLGFQLFDANGVLIIPEVGHVITVKVANKTGVVYETTAVVVDDHIEFTIAENIGAGKMRVELTVSDGANILQKYPANGYIELLISASLDDVGVGGIYTVTAQEMFALIADTQAQFVAVVNRETDTDAMSRQAAINADSVDMINLKARLDDDYNTVTSSLAENDKQLISKLNYDMSKGIVTIIDDDASDIFFTGWKTVADNSGIKLSSAINTSEVGNAGKMTLAQLQQLKSENFDILSHFHTHLDLNVATLATIETEMQTSLDYLENNNIGDDLAIVYTKGLSSITDTNKRIQVKTLARKYYKYGVNDSGGVNYLPVDSYEVKRRNISLGTQTLADIQPYIDEAFANNQWLVILTHANLGWNATVAQDIVTYIQSLSMPIMTFKVAESYVGNVISHGDTRTPNYHFVSKTGASVDSTVRKPSMNPIPISNIDAPIESYDYDKTTDVLLNYIQDTYYSTGGIMKVYRGAKFYSYALFFPSRKKNVYRRYWDDTTTTWSEWVDLTSVAVDSESVVITRDLSLVGVQSIPIIYTTKTIKNINVFGAVNGTKKTCIGNFTNPNKSCIYQDGTSGNTHTSNVPLVFSQDSAANRSQGQLQTPVGALNISWTVLSGTGATGTAQITLQIEYA